MFELDEVDLGSYCGLRTDDTASYQGTLGGFAELVSVVAGFPRKDYTLAINNFLPADGDNPFTIEALRKADLDAERQYLRLAR